MWRFFRWVDKVLNTPIMSLPWESQGRRYERELDHRPVLDDRVFHQTYYAGSGIPEAIPAGVRRVYVAQLGRRWHAVRPDDRPADFLPDLDLADLLDEVAEAFGLTIPRTEIEAMDGSFDAVVRYLAGRSAVARDPARDQDGGAAG
jgi:hypothetical protein